jgi:hypothetical protein
MIKWEFIGRLHPLILHLPIGLIFGLFLIEGLSLVVDSGARAWQICRKAYIALLALSSVAAVLTGYHLSLEGQSSGEILVRHKWFGFAVAGLSLVLWMLVTLRSHQSKGRISSGFHLLVIVGLLGAISVTGHLGGQLTHGPRFLATHAPPALQAYLGPPPQDTPEPMPAESLTVYHQLIQPILAQHCAFCHGPDRKMGQLAVHTHEDLMAGGSLGPVVLPDIPQNSELVKRILLPLGDVGHMPPEGKSQLSPLHVTALQWWIKEGASHETNWDDQDIPHELTELLPATVAPTNPLNETETPTQLDESLIRSLVDQQVSIQRIRQDTQHLWISFPAIAHQVTDETIEQFSPLSPFIVWLDLSQTQIGPKTLKWIATLPVLTELNLRQTSVTAQDLAPLAQHSSLERLNLSQVSLDDTVVDILLTMPRLKRVYLGGSQISDTGIRRLSAPRVEVITEAHPSEVISTDPNGATTP